MFLACDVGIDFWKGGLEGGRAQPCGICGILRVFKTTCQKALWDMWDFSVFLA